MLKYESKPILFTQNCDERSIFYCNATTWLKSAPNAGLVVHINCWYANGRVGESIDSVLLSPQQDSQFDSPQKCKIAAKTI